MRMTAITTQFPGVGADAVHPRIVRQRLAPESGAGRFHLTALLVGIFMLVAAPMAHAAAPYPTSMCPADRLATDLNCTANDVEVASIDVLNNVTTCVAGNPVSLHLRANLHANAQNRYNVGIFIAQTAGRRS